MSVTLTQACYITCSEVEAVYLKSKASDLVEKLCVHHNW